MSRERLQASSRICAQVSFHLDHSESAPKFIDSLELSVIQEGGLILCALYLEERGSRALSPLPVALPP